MTDELRRRTDVPPAVALAIEEVVRDTRHGLRNEITAAVAPLAGRLASLEARVAESTLRSTEEHADVKAKLDRLQESAGAVGPLSTRVTELEETERADRAVAEALERMNRRVYALAGLVISATGVLAGILLSH